MSYPLSLPSSRGIRKITFRPRSVVGVGASPYTLSQEVFVHAGEAWAADVELVPMEREDAEPWLAWLLGLNGREGTFYLGDPKGAAPRGTWSGSILVRGASQTGKALIVDGASPFATAKAGDWFQLGTGLHKVTQDALFDSSGETTLRFWPGLRSSPADNAALTLLAAKGVFRLSGSEQQWVEEELEYGLSFSCEEAF